MYEEQTFEVILERLLARVSDTLDKREGSIIYDAMAPMGAELAQLYICLGNLIDCTFADTAPREYLIRRAAERGLVPLAATYAMGIGEFNIDVPIGSRFSSGSFNWAVTEKIDTGKFRMLCETAGATPNEDKGRLLPINYIDGLERADLSSIDIPGENEEDTEVFRKRYFDSFRSQAFCGNKQDYYNKITAQPGVGGCKIFRGTDANGKEAGGHVLAVITSSNYGVANPELVENVQQVIDPNQDQLGDGLAPIGHVCHIQSAVGVKIAIIANIVYQDEYQDNPDILKPQIEAAVDAYFLSLNETWEQRNQENPIIVRVSAIESRILAIEGVIDITDTKLKCNGVEVEGNITLADNEIAVREGD